VAFAAAPTNPSIVFAGTANGGVWETTNINQTATVDVNQISVPSLAPGPNASGMLANGNAAAANGTVTYKISFVDSTGVESNGSQAVSFSLGNTATFNLSNIPTGPTFGPPLNSNTVARNIYRLVTVGNTSYYGLVGSLKDNTTTTFKDFLANTPSKTTARFESIPSPNWVPLTDNFPSLSISALTVAPDTAVGVPDGFVVYAGTGTASSSRQGAGAGLLISIDGGDIWSRITSDALSGLTITGIQVVPNNGSARNVVISTSGTDTQPGGIFLINIPNIATPDVNAQIVRPAGPAVAGITAMPYGTVSDLASVPAAAAPGVAVGGNPVLFAALTPGAPLSAGVQPGIYQSTDGGKLLGPGLGVPECHAQYRDPHPLRRRFQRRGPRFSPSTRA